MKKLNKHFWYSFFEVTAAVVVLIVTITCLSIGYTILNRKPAIDPTGEVDYNVPDKTPEPEPEVNPTPVDPTQDADPDPQPEPQPEPEKDITEYAVGLTSANGSYYSWNDLVEAGYIEMDSLDETRVNQINLEELDLEEAVFVFPDNIETLSQFCIYQADIKTIYFSETSNLTTIEASFVGYCFNLKEFYIPKSVETMYGSPVTFCRNAEIILDPENEYYEYREDDHVIMEKATHRLVVGYDDSTIPEDTLIIGTGAFSSRNLGELFIPEGVTTIEQYAFESSGVAFIELPTTLETIEEDAFCDCQKLCEIANKSSLVIEPGTSNGSIAEYSTEEMIYNDAENGYTRYSYRMGDFIVIDVDLGGMIHAILGYVGNDTEITTPDGYEVLIQRAFFNTNIESVTFSNDVIEIYSEVCGYCDRLSEVNFGNSVEYIMDDAFYQCLSLKELVLSDSITEIGSFQECKNLESVTLSANLEYYSSAFSYLESLKTVIIPEGVTKIDSNAFNGCTALEEIVLPSTITEICYRSFDSTGLKSVNIPQNVSSIDMTAFSNCTNIESISVDSLNATYDSRDNCNAIIETSTNAIKLACKNTIIPTTVESYDANLVKSLGLESIYIPSGMTIGNNAFKDCTSLTSVTIAEGVASIGQYAFSGCTSLEEIVIPSTVTTIGVGAFANCTSLESIEVDPSNTAYDSRNNCNAIMKTSTNYVIAACTNTVLPDDTYGIGQSAFEGLDITEIILPVSCSDISPNAFKNCKELVSIRYADGVESAVMFHIFDNAFFGCSKLEVIDIPQIAYNINTNVFLYCDSLTDIYYYNTVSNWQGRITSFMSGNGTGHTITVHCTDGDYIWN